MSKSLAVKYRPKTWLDVTEQDAIKTILTQQIESGEIKNGYLFCGGAGTGKTTCARIFANEINKGQGTPIEMDAASNNSVEDIRNVIAQAQTKSLDSEYKIFIIDEAHSLSNSAWQAMLKTLEEPPAKSIFIFATTDPQKIPKTILSRVQRYDFQRLTMKGIVSRLEHILHCEMADFDNFSDFTFTEDFAGNWKSGDVVRCEKRSDGILVDGVALIDSMELLKHGHFNLSITYDSEALEYLAKIADGGMRDAITLMDKCLSYSTELTVDNVVKALGIANYDVMFSLLDSLIEHKTQLALEQIDSVYKSGIEMKQFIKTFMEFALDVCKYGLTRDFALLKMPNTYQNVLDKFGDYEYAETHRLLKDLISLNAEIKWDPSPKYSIEAKLFMFCEVSNGRDN